MFSRFRARLFIESIKAHWLSYIIIGMLVLMAPIIFDYVDDIYYKNNSSLKRPYERLRDELTVMYQEFELLPGTDLVNDGWSIKDDTGCIYYNFSTALSLEEVVEYYDKEFKNKGWAFKDIEISRDLFGGGPTGAKSFRYTRGKYLAYIYYNPDKHDKLAANKTGFSIFVAFYRGNMY